MTKGHNIYDSSGNKIGRALIDGPGRGSGGGTGGLEFAGGLIGFLLMLLPPMWAADSLWEKTPGFGKFGLNLTSLAAVPFSVLSCALLIYLVDRQPGSADDMSLADAIAGIVYFSSAVGIFLTVPFSLLSLLFVGVAEKVIAACILATTIVLLAATAAFFF